MPSQKQRKGHIVQNENIQRYVSVKFPLKSCKISNINIEILRLHEDYVTTQFLPECYRMAWYSWWHQIFETDRRNVKRRTICFSEEVLHVGEEDRSHTVSLQKFVNEILLRAAIDRLAAAQQTIFLYLWHCFYWGK